MHGRLRHRISSEPGWRIIYHQQRIRLIALTLSVEPAALSASGLIDSSPKGDESFALLWERLQAPRKGTSFGRDASNTVATSIAPEGAHMVRSRSILFESALEIRLAGRLRSQPNGWSSRLHKQQRPRSLGETRALSARPSWPRMKINRLLGFLLHQLLDHA
jgi:hypothetical protein